jgi:hypothetical protein
MVDPPAPRWRRLLRTAGIVLLTIVVLRLLVPEWFRDAMLDGIFGEYRGRSIGRMPVSTATVSESQSSFRLAEGGTYVAVLALKGADQQLYPAGNDSLPFASLITINIAGKSVARTPERGSILLGREGEALIIASFESPSDIPRWRTGTVTFAVTRPDSLFERENGPLVFYLLRISAK